MIYLTLLPSADAILWDVIFLQAEYPNLWKTFHCLAQAINSTTASIVCGKDPTMEEIKDALYYGLCRPWDVKFVKINCLSNHYSTLGYLYSNYHIDNIFANTPQCYCATVLHTKGLIQHDHMGKPKILNTSCHLNVTDYNIRWMNNMFSLILVSIPTAYINYKLLSSLSDLKLYGTGIQEITLFDMAYIKNLKTLVLSIGLYRGILQNWKDQAEHLDGYEISLYELELSSCSIDHIPDEIFISVNVRVILTLWGNQITVINKSTFRGLNTLHTLDLSYNDIHFIHADSFKHMTHLNTIKLNNNKLITLHMDTIYINGIAFLMSIGYPICYHMCTPMDYACRLL